MTMRLDRQRPPIRFHRRRRSRMYTRGYDNRPHRAWGDAAQTPTAATAGTPGTFTPTGSQPATLAALVSAGALGNTVTWTTGQFIYLGDGSKAYWNGTTWIAGVKP